MTVSEKQLLANQSNALKSTGPKTEEGKGISSKNATTHGLRSVHPVVDGEDPAEYNEFRNDMILQFAPIGPMERLLVDRIVHSAWRLRRIGTIEIEMFDFLRHRSVKKQKKIFISYEPPRPAPRKMRFNSFDEARDAWLETEDGKTYQENLWPLDVGFPRPMQAFDKFMYEPEQSDRMDDHEKSLPAVAAAPNEDAATTEPPLTLGRAFAEDLPKNGTFARLSRYESSIERSMFKSLRQLQDLQLQRPA